MKSALSYALAAICFADQAPALGQSEPDPSPELQSYDAEYFDAFAPQTAFDMVLRLPGFSIDEGDQRRGLGQGGANILINGARLSGKTNSPIEQLQQIPASQVKKIDIIDGATSGIPGLTGPVANILTASSGLAVTWSWEPESRRYVRINLGRAAATVTGSQGNLDFTLSARNTSNYIASRGPELRTHPSVSEPQIFLEEFTGVAIGPTLSANVTWDLGDSWVSKTQMEYSDFDITEQELSQQQDGLARSIFDFELERRQGEISTELSRDLSGGRAKLIALQNFLTDAEFSSSVRDQIGGTPFANRFLVDLEQTERILRAEYDRTYRPGNTLQFAAEYARNELDSTSTLLVSDNNDTFQPVNLPDANTNVIEDRFELTGTRSWRLSAITDFQLSIGAEYSTLQQRREAGAIERQFFRPKGFAVLTVKPTKTLTLTARIERTVGQLNFFDFTSSVGLQEGVNQSGNPDLVPQQSWLAQGNIDKRFAGGHVIVLNAFYEAISDLVDRIPIGQTGDGVGNIDSGRRWGAEIRATLKGAPLGLDGVELNANFKLEDSELRDPITSVTRRINRQTVSFYEVRLVHDIPKSNWAYGAEISQSRFSDVFRASTIDSFDETPLVSAFLEHKDVFGARLRASVINATDNVLALDRSIFSGRRDRSMIAETQSRQRRSKPYFQLSISGTF